MDLPKPLYHRRRFPAEIISHCVWLYFRFCLSYRDVEEMMAERGVVVTYETIRDWSQKFSGTYARRLRRGHRAPEIDGISMKSISRSMASCSICGAPSIHKRASLQFRRHPHWSVRPTSWVCPLPY